MGLTKGITANVYQMDFREYSFEQVWKLKMELNPPQDSHEPICILF